jgi:hypothetical protein
MEGLISFFNNNWVISIITGLLVAILTDLWNRFRKRKEYIQKVKTANKEVFNSIKAYIPEDTLPAPSVLFSLQRSTAKEYDLKRTDLEPLRDIFDSLIKEVMDSSFLSYQAKLTNCNKLQEYLSILIEMEMKIEELNKLRSSDFKASLEISKPIMAGIAASTILISSNSFNEIISIELNSSYPSWFYAIIFSGISLGIAHYLKIYFERKTEEQKKKNEKNKEKKGA